MRVSYGYIRAAENISNFRKIAERRVSMKVYKYHLAPENKNFSDFGFCPLILPNDAEILHVGLQGEQVFVWARVHSAGVPKIGRRFHIVATGADVPQEWKHWATLQLSTSLMVLHVFEEFLS